MFIGILNLKLCGDSNNRVIPLTNSWEIAVPHQELPEGLTSLNSDQCGICHPNHYKEWRMSTHSHAWTDLQFQSEIKKESSPFMCINCHTPLQNQQEFIIKGLIDGDIYNPLKEKNAHFDKSLQHEGINCASCHVRNNTIIGPLGTGKAPHVTIKDKKHLSEELCISCHNAVAVITPSLACSFETGDEWKAGLYYEEKNCLDCHMEPIIREITPGFGQRLSHLHYFPGSGIPKFDSVETKALNGMKIYPPDIKEGYSLKDSLVFTLKVKNEYAGHRLPTGDPERFFIIQFELKNDSGQVLSSKTERIGEHWQWYPEAKKISDNNLNINEERSFKFAYKCKEKSSLSLFVTVTKHRLDKKSADYNKLDDTYPLFITIFKEQYDFQIR